MRISDWSSDVCSSDLAAVLARDAGGILANDDPRAQIPPLATLMTLDWNGLKPVIADSLTHGAIEIGVVGDIDEAAAIDAIAATFGARPPRRAAFDPRDRAREIVRTAGRERVGTTG